MRITTSSSNAHFIREMNALKSQQNNLSRQISTGQKIHGSEDGAASVARASAASTEKSKIQAFANNINRAETIGNLSLESLQLFKGISDSASDLGLVNDGHSSPMDLLSKDANIRQLINQGINSLNAKLGGDYLFAGANISEIPFEAQRYTEFLEDAEGNYVNISGNPIAPGDPPVASVMRDTTGAIVFDAKGDPIPLPDNYIGEAYSVSYTGSVSRGDDVRFRVSENSQVDPFSRGSQNAGYGEVLNNMIALRDAFLSEDMNGISVRADALENSRINVNDGIVELAVKVNGIKTVEQINAGRFNQLESNISELVDADLAETIVEFNRMQTAYEATLSSGARILNLSLLDYLR